MEWKTIGQEHENTLVGLIKVRIMAGMRFFQALCGIWLCLSDAGFEIHAGPEKAVAFRPPTVHICKTPALAQRL
jgi:hypothetical protein